MRNVHLLLEETLAFQKDLSKHKTLLFSNSSFCVQLISLCQYLSSPKGPCTCIKSKEKKLRKRKAKNMQCEQLCTTASKRVLWQLYSPTLQLSYKDSN